MNRFANISNTQLSAIIDEWIKNERDRKLMKRRLIDGISLERLAEEFELSPKPNDCPSCYSVADFAADHPQGVYILGTGHHAVTVKHGDWLDSWDSGAECPIYYYTKE